MFKRDTKQWVGSSDGKKTSEIIMKGGPFKHPYTFIGAGLVLGGLAIMARGSWISGATDYLRAESKSLKDVGCLNMTEEEIKSISC